MNGGGNKFLSDDEVDVKSISTNTDSNAFLSDEEVDISVQKKTEVGKESTTPLQQPTTPSATSTSESKKVTTEFGEPAVMLEEVEVVGEKEKPTFTESVKGSYDNFITQLKSFVPNTQIAAADVWENVLGKELAQKWYNLEGRDIDEVRSNAYKKLDVLQKQYQPTRGIIESVSTGDAAGVAAGVVDAVSSILSTGITSGATLGGGLITDMVGRSIADYNTEKAKTKGVTIDDLYKSGNADIAVPAMIGLVGAGLEQFGLKGTQQAITSKITPLAAKRLAKFGIEANKEGLTEYTQTILDDVNKAVAQGKTGEQIAQVALQTATSERAMEAYLKGAVGSAGAAIGGKVITNGYKGLSKEESKSLNEAIGVDGGMSIANAVNKAVERGVMDATQGAKVMQTLKPRIESVNNLPPALIDNTEAVEANTEIKILDAKKANANEVEAAYIDAEKNELEKKIPLPLPNKYVNTAGQNTSELKDGQLYITRKGDVWMWDAAQKQFLEPPKSFEVEAQKQIQKELDELPLAPITDDAAQAERKRKEDEIRAKYETEQVKQTEEVAPQPEEATPQAGIVVEGEEKTNNVNGYEFTKTPTLESVIVEPIDKSNNAVIEKQMFVDENKNVLAKGVKYVGGGWYEIGRDNFGSVDLYNTVTKEGVSLNHKQGGRMGVVVQDFIKNNSRYNDNIAVRGSKFTQEEHNPKFGGSGHYKGTYFYVGLSAESKALEHGKNLTKVDIEKANLYELGEDGQTSQSLKNEAKKAGYDTRDASGYAESEYLKKQGYDGIKRGNEIVLFEPKKFEVKEKIADLPNVSGGTVKQSVPEKGATAVFVSKYSDNPLQMARREKYLDSAVMSNGKQTTERKLIEERVKQGWRVTKRTITDDAASKKLNQEYERLKRTAPIGNENHPETKRLRELEKMPKSLYNEREIAVKKEELRLESPEGTTIAITPFGEDYVNELLFKEQSLKETPQEEAETVAKEQPSTETVQAEAEVAPKLDALKDVESTAKALDENNSIPNKSLSREQYALLAKESAISYEKSRGNYNEFNAKRIEKDYQNNLKSIKENNELTDTNEYLYNNGTISGISKEISEAYHRAKADGSNPELVKAVEELLAPQSQAKPLQTEAEGQVATQQKETKGNKNEIQLESGFVAKEISGKNREGDSIVGYEVYNPSDPFYKITFLKNEKTGEYGLGETSLDLFAAQDAGIIKTNPNNTMEIDVEQAFNQIVGKQKSDLTALNQAQPAAEIDQVDAEVGSKTYKQKSETYPKGRTREKTLPDGTKLKGTFKIVSADDVLASHNEQTFAKTDGFPTNEKGKTVNDRDYETDKAAQSEVVRIASNLDERAVSQTPIVTKDGIVVDGNNRTMSRKLAAKQGTDKAYLDALKADADMYGIEPSEIDGVKNPMLVFEAEQKIPYTTKEFARFNKAEKKEKSPVEKAVELSKTISDRARRILGGIYEGAATPSEVTSNKKSMSEIRDLLISEGILQQNELPRYINPETGTATKEGVSFLETLLIGTSLDENTIRMLDNEGMGNAREKVLKAVVQITQNAALGENSLQSNIENGVKLLNKAKQSNQSVVDAVSQMDMFEVSAFTSEDLAVAILLDGSGFKDFLKRYNSEVGTESLFEGTLTKEKIIDTLLSQKIKNYEQVRKNLRADAKQGEGAVSKVDGSDSGKAEPNIFDQYDNTKGASKKDKVIEQYAKESGKDKADRVRDIIDNFDAIKSRLQELISEGKIDNIEIRC